MNRIEKAAVVVGGAALAGAAVAQGLRMRRRTWRDRAAGLVLLARRRLAALRPPHVRPAH